MKEVLAEANALGVDGDIIQNLAGRQDWEGLRQAVAEKHRIKREAREAEERALQEQAAAVGGGEQDKVFAELARHLAESNERLRRACA